MPPSTNRKLRDPDTIREAFEAMQVWSLFVFNDRERQLQVTQTFDDYLIASVLRRSGGTAHRFIWGGYDRPRHKPSENQTNIVHSLTVGSYGKQPTKNAPLTQELSHKFGGMEHVEVYDAGAGGARIVGAVGSVTPHLNDNLEVTPVNNRAIEVNYS